MAVEIKVTPAGESITHATLLKWLRPEGASVKAGEPVCELETDKATKEEYAPVNGVLSIRVQPGTKVAIGAVIGAVDPDGKPKGDRPPTADAKQAAPAPQANSVAAPTPTAPSHAGVRLSPAARVLVESQGIDASKVPPSSRGVVTKSDVLSFLESRPSTPAAAPPAPPPAEPPAEAKPAGAARETRVRMTPIRARIAERLLQAQQNAAILTTF